MKLKNTLFFLRLTSPWDVLHILSFSKETDKEAAKIGIARNTLLY